MSERFFSATPIATNHVTLADAEAHHLLHVMCAAVGDRLILFDGSGAEFDAVVETVARTSAVVQIIDRREANRELPFPLTVGVALPKGERQKWLVEKLTELGVTQLVPLVTERGVAQPTAGTLERLQRAVIEASKQSGRNRLMHIAQPTNWPEWLSSSTDEAARRLVAHPGGTLAGALALSTKRPTQLAIGPEGGFSESEIVAARAARWQTVEVGPRILRVETAALALTSAVCLA